MFKKMLCSFIVALLTIFSYVEVKAESISIEPKRNEEIVYDTSSNFFGKVEDKTTISNPDSSVLDNYKLVSTVNSTSLYVDEEKLNIAIKLKNGYIFYSVPNYYGFNISAYLTTGGLSEVSSTLLVDGMYKSSMMDASQKPKLVFDYTIKNGFKVYIKFLELGIVIPVYVSLNDEANLIVEVLKDEIIEEGYTKESTTIEKDENGKLKKDENGKYIKTTTSIHYDYYLSSITLFPYFGAVGENTTKDSNGNDIVFNNKINGYVFIPDGSGALVRYQYDRTYTTKFTKRIYGNDYGIKEESISKEHLQSDITIDVPIYGVNHGYNQQAFMNVIKDGAGEAELVLEPFGYSRRNITTAYYKFYLRETYNVAISTSDTGSTTTISSKINNTDYSMEYSFLYDTEANYSGMAKEYRENYLELSKLNSVNTEVPLGLNVLAQDYKKGLFGKKFINMTTYDELYEIISDLENSNVNNFSIVYKGMNKNGYYNNNNYKPKLSRNLGSKKDYNNLINHIIDNNYNLDYAVDILTSYKETNKNVVKKLNLNVFSKGSTSTLFDETYLYNVEGSSSRITKYNKNYNKLNISSINLGNYSKDIYSYRYKSTNYTRSETINKHNNELAKLDDLYSLSLNKAYSYSYNYVDRIYYNETSSSLYTYYTDSVPFISLVLSSYCDLFSKEINFIADYNQYCLRLIEYNIYPYFVITNNDSSKLRYTNNENLYTSEYSLWSNEIKLFYKYINDSLKYVRNSSMINHEYVSNGVAKVTYDNGYKIYVNYNNSDVNVDGVIIEKLSYKVVK